jgi:hypothetical protein
MKERGTSGNITPQIVNESKTQYVTTGHQVREGSNSKDCTYRQQNKRSKRTYEEFLLELNQGKM